MLLALSLAAFCSACFPCQASAAPGTQESRPASSAQLAAGTASSAAKRTAYEQHALTHEGDPRRGRELYQNEKLTKCTVCHKTGGLGGDVGPELSHIGGKFDRPHLIESLLEPSRQIVEGFRTSVITTVDGRVETGIVKGQSRRTVTLVDANGKQHLIATKNIDQRVESAVSLMPEGLADALTLDQFTDLISYLETLRPGGKLTPGAGVAGAIKLPAGFEIKTVATGLTGCTALEPTADGRIFLCEQFGALRVVKNGALLDKPFVTIPVDSTWERGLIGVTAHPDFPKTPFVYVCYVAKDPYPHHRVSRFTADGDVAVAGSERILLSGDDQRKLGGQVPAGHQGGALHFGHDGKLYVAIGEQTAEKPSQHLGTLQGKMLRLNPDGSIPGDNPFVQKTRGKYQSIWALGLRNPFTFAVHPATGEMLINDVGGKFEEINRGAAGANYGWPTVEHGPTPDPRFVGPIYWYPESSIVGGDFVPDSSSWPKAYLGRYIFADFVQGWIKTLDSKKPSDVRAFASALHRPVGLRFAPDGSLYVLLRNAWVVDDKFRPNTGALLQIRYASEAVARGRSRSEAGTSTHAVELPHGQVRAASQAPEKLARIGVLLQEAVDRKQIAGAAALIAKKGEIIYRATVGMQDLEAKKPLEKNTIFRIASMTKPVTSTAIMMLIEEGKLSLSDPISKYLPEFKEVGVMVATKGSGETGFKVVKAEREPTIHDLLTHTSGLTYGFFNRPLLGKLYADAGVSDGLVETPGTIGENVLRLAKLPLLYQPGTHWEYGLSADVLGRVIEVVSGRSLEAFFSERIFKPLQMNDTYFNLPVAKRSRLAALYTVTGPNNTLRRVGPEPVRDGALTYSSTYSTQDQGTYFSGGGGLVSTIDDYSRFLQMLLNGGELNGVRLLKPETVALMTRNQIGALTIAFRDHGDGFGYGFGVLTERGRDKDPAGVGTYSWGGIFYTYFWVDPQNKLVGILMTQVYPSEHLRLREEFKRLTYEGVAP